MRTENLPFKFDLRKRFPDMRRLDIFEGGAEFAAEKECGQARVRLSNLANLETFVSLLLLKLRGQVSPGRTTTTSCFDNRT